MSANKERNHWIVLPEDDAYRQLANGFLGGIAPERQRQIQVMAPAGGWLKAVELVGRNYVTSMRRYERRHLVLLIDFDGSPSRFMDASKNVPPEIAERVFIIGSFKEAEHLRNSMKLPYETIGRRAADSCERDIPDFWKDDLLQHNMPEVQRIQDRFRQALFA